MTRLTRFSSPFWRVPMPGSSAVTFSCPITFIYFVRRARAPSPSTIGFDSGRAGSPDSMRARTTAGRVFIGIPASAGRTATPASGITCVATQFERGWSGVPTNGLIRASSMNWSGGSCHGIGLSGGFALPFQSDATSACLGGRASGEPARSRRTDARPPRGWAQQELRPPVNVRGPSRQGRAGSSSPVRLPGQPAVDSAGGPGAGLRPTPSPKEIVTWTSPRPSGCRPSSG